MKRRLQAILLAPLPLDDVVARIELDGGVASTKVVLRGGRFDGQVDGTPTRLVLTLEAVPARVPEAPEPARTAGDDAPNGPPLEVSELFEHGVVVPADGRLVRAVLWGTACDESRSQPPGEPGGGTRFGSFEHMLCAANIGLDAAGSTLIIDGITAEFNHETRFDVGDKALRFGEIIALSGDYYAHLDAVAALELADAWPARTGFLGLVTGDYRATTLLGDDPAAVRATLGVILRDRDKSHGFVGEAFQIAHDLPAGYPARRYLALACSNYCHFASQPDRGPYIDDARNEALRLYRAYHARAIREAVRGAHAANRQRVLHAALVTDAFGCHFLTDLFASGHIRVPRRVLGERFGVLKGSLRMSAQMHDEDNRLGLWCAPRAPAPGPSRMVWRAFGDGALRHDEARPHLAQVREAVRRSAAEVFQAWCEAEVPASAPSDRADALVPAPLPAGVAPGASDRLPDGLPIPAGAQPNHFPLFRVLDDGSVARRTGAITAPSYEVISGPLSPRLVTPPSPMDVRRMET